MSLRSHDDEPRRPVGRAIGFARRIEDAFLTFVREHSLTLLRYALVTVFVWFGLLTTSGVNGIAGLIADVLWVLPSGSVDLLLGGWEIAIGLALLSRRTTRLAVVLAAAYVAVIMLPLVVSPEATFTQFPYGPSFEGVYILKDWVLLGGVMTVGGLLEE
ncbi:hypothetical protein [Halalkalicoccus tibetensis]|uniref:DoxX family protein n=1 Tax=Halalkalicoccus tibetensis TaxID=175632 RepID=A0ABD5V739_9EURY